MTNLVGANKINLAKTPKLATFAIEADTLASKLTYVYQTQQYTGYKLKDTTPNPHNHFIMTASSKSVKIGVPPKVAAKLTQYAFVPSTDETEFHTLTINESSLECAADVICSIIKSLN